MLRILFTTRTRRVVLLQILWPSQFTQTWPKRFRVRGHFDEGSCRYARMLYHCDRVINHYTRDFVYRCHFLAVIRDNEFCYSTLKESLSTASPAEILHSSILSNMEFSLHHDLPPGNGHNVLINEIETFTQSLYIVHVYHK